MARRRKQEVVEWSMSVGELEAIKKQRELWKNNILDFGRKKGWVLDRESPESAGLKQITWWPSQIYAHETIERIGDFNLERAQKMRGEGLEAPLTRLPIRTQAVKARRVGWSFYLEFRGFCKCEYEPNTRGLLMAHERDTGRVIKQMVEIIHTNWTTDSPGEKSLLTINRDDLIEWEHGSSLSVKTASHKGGAAAAGQHFHYGHLTEVPKFPEGSVELSNALQAMAPYSETHLEGTAEGWNHYKISWDNCMWLEDAIRLFKNGHNFPKNWNGYFKLFWGWWQDENYRVKLLKSEKDYVQGTLTGYEKELVERYKLDLEQVEWRRRKLQNECSRQTKMSREKYFLQEYPGCPEDAFVAQGKNVFDTEKLKLMIAVAEDLERAYENKEVNAAGIKKYKIPVRVTSLKKNQEHQSWADMFSFVDVPFISGANCIIYEEPLVGEAYCAGIDTASGQGRDYSVISIGRRLGINKLRKVCKYKAMADPDLIIEVALFLLTLYNDAYTVVERVDGSGERVAVGLAKSGYPNLYTYKNEALFSDRPDPRSFVVGFKTSPSNKPVLIAAGVRYLREDGIEMYSSEGLKEWLKFSYKDTERAMAAAPEGEFDDEVMCDLLMLHAHEEGPPLIVERNRSLEEVPNGLEGEDLINWHLKSRIVTFRNRKKEEAQRLIESMMDRLEDEDKIIIDLIRN